MAITKGQIARYTLLPQIAPRIRDLASSGFSSLAFLMALVYGALRILPATHPYLIPANMGKYGLVQVIAAAGNHLPIGWKNIDKIILFVIILAGLILLILQFFILLLVVFSSPALASGIGELATYFTTAKPQEDIAFRLLDNVFGIPELFNSKDAAGLPRPFHVALHNLFQLYSVGILIVAVFILVYFMFAIAAETAQSGTPFGKRFNHVWAPIRLVVAFGLLIPFGYGFNSAQWITLYAAKWGSGFATNGWLKFNETVSESYEEKHKLVATPNIPDINHLPSFMMLTHACNWLYEARKDVRIKAWLVKNPAEGEAIEFVATSYEEALEFFNFGDIHVRFGEKDEKHSNFRGSVMPFCGHIVLQTTDVAAPGEKPGSYIIQEGYYELVKSLWATSGGGDHDLSKNAAAYVRKWGNVNRAKASAVGMPDPPLLPTQLYKQDVVDSLRLKISKIVSDGIEAQKELSEWEIDQQLLDFGWAGAAIWYNKIAELNGTVLSAIHNIPRPHLLPSVMEYTKKRRLEQDSTVPPEDMYTPKMSKIGAIPYKAGDDIIARTLNYVYRYWQADGLNIDNTKAQITGNAFIDAINALLGTEGLFDICKNTDIHPLAQLSHVGKSLIESAVRNFGYSFFSGTFGGLAYLASDHLGAASFAISGFFTTVGGTGLLIGFMLFYVMPFLPFLYFFFAVGGWVKGLFEAMVGVPLWALAHLRIDGEGLPGEAAQNGYFLIFEIFLRPILIVFGLLAAILVFTAMVKILNEIFYLAVANLSGFNPDTAQACGMTSGSTTEVTRIEYFRGPVDQFFFTIMYTIIVYMIGMSCFKLIDLIPNKIMRWMGSSASGYSDLGGETAEGLQQKLMIGGGIVGNSLSGAASSLSGAGQSVSKQLASMK